LAAKGRQIETEAAPIRYVAELLATDTDGERAIRWLIALMVVCCDPLAIALATASALTQTIHRETRRGPLADGLPATLAFRATQSLNAAC